MADKKGAQAAIGFVLTVLVIVAIGLGVGLTRRKSQDAETESNTATTVVPEAEPSATTTVRPALTSGEQNALQFFKADDALNIRWYHAANSLAQMEEALTGDYQMLEGDIILNWYGLPNQTNEPVMAYPSQLTSNNTLRNWLQNILTRTDKAPKLHIRGEDVLEPSLRVLRNLSSLVSQPVWISADILKGPGSGSQPFDGVSMIRAVNKYSPNVTLSLGWTTSCCGPFTRENMEAMWAQIKDVSQPITITTRAVLLKESWLEFKWLLEKNPGLTITVWSPSDAIPWEGATPYDMLYVRNDIDKRLIYYDLPGPLFETFKLLAVTAGSPFNHFEGMASVRDGIKITWAHRVNSQQSLKDALSGDVHMLETDVLLRGQGTENQTNIPIMAHPPETDSDITLQEWLTKVVNTSKGIKLDFKSNDVLLPSMEVLKGFAGQFEQPVWLNADILQGPNTNGTPNINATDFKQIMLKNFPESTLSIGWTTKPGDGGYTKEMIQEMQDYASDLVQPITFPVRAMLVRRSWDNLKALLDQSLAYSLTIWSNNDPVDPDDMVFVRQNYAIDRIYYDLPDWLMDAFLERLNGTTVV